MITLIIYCAFSYLFMISYCLAWYANDDFRVFSAMIFIVFSPVIAPVALGHEFYRSTEVK